MFKLHSQLEKDLITIGELPLCQLMLLADSDNPWVVLVPRVPDIKEWHHLNQEQQFILTKEISIVSELFDKQFHPDKINIGSLGNMVPQLHVHIIGRFVNDKCWPHSIWGSSPGKDSEKISNWVTLIKSSLNI